MAITGVVVRRQVDDLPAATAFYEQLTGEPARRFSADGADLAAVGPFLLFAASDDASGDASGDAAERFARVAATVTVDDLDEMASRLVALGAQVVAPAAPTPNGRRLVARHPDGAVFEYVGR